MITTKNLLSVLKKPRVIYDIYNREIEIIAAQNDGAFILDENTQREVANKAFNTVAKEGIVNASWEECVAIFDIMDRRK